jgi:hypothetical protein
MVTDSLGFFLFIIWFYQEERNVQLIGQRMLASMVDDPEPSVFTDEPNAW